MALLTGTFQIIEIDSFVEQGVTEPIKCKLDGDINCVVKYPNNRCGTAILANEFIGHSIASQAGVYGPSFGICHLTCKVAETFYNGGEGLDDSNCGLCFFTVLLPKLEPRVLWNRVNPHAAAKIILIDHILNNFDRHSGNLQFDFKETKLVSIDYSHIFGKKKGISPDYLSGYLSNGMKEDAYLYDDILRENQEEYENLFVFGGCNETVLMEEMEIIKDAVTEKYIDDVINGVPPEWIEAVGSDTINVISRFIKFRVNHLDSITKMIIEDRRRR